MKLTRISKSSMIKARIIIIIISIFGLSVEFFYAQQNDTLKRVLNDKELFKWVENYILENGYIKKNANESGNLTDVSGRYILHKIEEVKKDSNVIVLYRFKILSSAYRTGLVLRVTNNTQVNDSFLAFGITPDLQHVHDLFSFLYYNDYKFTDSTKLYCYNMLLYNYYDYINREVGTMPKKKEKKKRRKIK